MASDLWLRQDLANLIAGIREAHTKTLGNATLEDKISQAYRRGFEDALDSVARSLGITPHPGEDGHRARLLVRER